MGSSWCQLNVTFLLLVKSLSGDVLTRIRHQRQATIQKLQALHVLSDSPGARITRDFGPAREGDADLAGVGFGYDYPIFWIDVFHSHSLKQHTAFRAISREQVDAFHREGLIAGGESPTTAIHVILTGEAYDWLGDKKLKVPQQYLQQDGRAKYDVIDVQDAQGAASQVYFDITRRYARYSQDDGAS